MRDSIIAARTHLQIHLKQSLPALRFPRVELPLILVAALLLVGLITVCSRARLYGISVDEPLQQQYGERVLAWFRTLGKDTSFLTAFPTVDHMPEHGGIFDAGIAALQSVFNGADPWLVRHLATGLFGLLGVLAIALCGWELGGGWVAFTAALGLWLYPRYSGAIYNNPKDVPAAVMMTFVLWATLLLVKRWGDPKAMVRLSLLLGVLIGVAAAIRVNALEWFGVLAVLLAGWWTVNGLATWRERRVWPELARQAVLAGTIGASSLLAMMLLWPYVALDPLPNLLHAIQVMRAYPWNGLVLYAGHEYRASQLPPSYVPAWLVLGSPPALVLLALLGVALATASVIGSVICGFERAFAERPYGRCDAPLDVRLDARVNARLATALPAFVLPLLVLLALHPVLYDTLRQYLYVVPPMILLAAVGLVRSITFLWERRYVGEGVRRTPLRWAAGAMLVVAVASYALVAREMAALSPFEYTYFSPIVGGLRGAAGAYDTDYWATCSKGAAEWLAAHYRAFAQYPSATENGPSVEGPVIEGTPMQSLIAPYLPASFHEDDAHPDFVIATTRDENDRMYPTYPIVHVVATQGVRLCVVKARTPTATGNATGG
ncbi:MAG TPA: hypothetical protein VF120_15970 [Ktedonobacterales bacterium]